jgi:hypothetical protein
MVLASCRQGQCIRLSTTDRMDKFLKASNQSKTEELEAQMQPKYTERQTRFTKNRDALLHAHKN